MDIFRFEQGEEQESVKNADALVFIFQDKNGKIYHLFSGQENELKELMIHGALNWPLFPLPQEKRDTLHSMLKKQNTPESLDYEKESDIFTLMELAESLAGEEGFKAGNGQHTFVFEGMPGHNTSMLVNGVDTYLLFTSVNSRKLIGRNGPGSQKQLMVFHAIEKFFNEEAHSLAEDIILGFEKELWYKFANQMRNAEEDEIFNIEDEEN